MRAFHKHATGIQTGRVVVGAPIAVNDLSVEEEDCAAINLMRRWAAVERATTTRGPEWNAWKDWSVKRALRTKATIKEQFAALEKIEDSIPGFKPVRENTCDLTDAELAKRGWQNLVPNVVAPSVSDAGSTAKKLTESFKSPGKAAVTVAVVLVLGLALKALFRR